MPEDEQELAAALDRSELSVTVFSIDGGVAIAMPTEDGQNPPAPADVLALLLTAASGICHTKGIDLADLVANAPGIDRGPAPRPMPRRRRGGRPHR